MAQIQKGDTFTNGEQVTAERLNQLIDSAILLPQVITTKTELLSTELATDDKFLVYDTSADSLKKVSVSAISGSGGDIVTSSITTASTPTRVNSVNITPLYNFDATSATYVASTYGTSPPINTVIVTSTNHGLSNNDYVQILLADSKYNGVWRIQVTSPNGFQYQVPDLATTVSGSLQWIKQGSVKIGTQIGNGNLYVAGNQYIDENLNVDGNAVINGTTYQLGPVIQSGNVTQTGTVNITGSFQYNGTPVFGLYSTETNLFSNMSTWSNSNGYARLPSWGYNWYLTTGNLHGTDVFVVPENEIWEISYNSFWQLSSDDSWSFVILLNDSPLHAVSQIQSGWKTFPATTTKFLVGGNGTTGVTYTFKFKSILVGGTGGTEFISLDAWSVGSRVVKKYKTA